ncbi:DNA mismatch repair protein MutL [Trametes meyenii]|nr:DNA mismatch repair protein MutL [Trametes meyenii]
MAASTSARAPSPPPPGPRPIRRLQEAVINRIAAGEIIHRPASALKELIENSLDAGATSIKVTVKEGGMKLLQIQDNGCGIRKDDLPILAERFTTSKLSTFSDLSHLTTYGFRGEALASISYVSNLTVVTKTKADTCAWKACYVDGTLSPVKAGATAEPKPCAGNDGTTITAENLFYNTPTRLSALRGSSEEYARILEVVTRYAVHNPRVSFTCKKTGSPAPDVSTPSSSTTVQAIRLLYGQTLAKELLHVSASSSDKKKSKDADARDTEDVSEDEDGEEGTWNAEAHFTNANYQAKKMTLLLFINHRLVESSRIKRALEAVYNGILAKGASPFIYLSLQIDPRSVDVNVHPTKKEVHFLNEDTIIERIADVVQEALIGQSQSRVFEYQTLLTGGIAEHPSQKVKGKRKAREDEDAGDNGDTNIEGQDGAPGGSQAPAAVSQSAKRKVYSQHKVRTSLKDRTLDSMFPVAHPSHQTGSGDGGSGAGTPATPPTLRNREVKESQCYLRSVRDLRDAVLKARHNQLSEILTKHTFVGVVDAARCLSLVQHGTRLFLLNHGALAAELFYQLGLRQFGNLPRIRLDPPPELRALVVLALDAEEGVEESGMSKADVADRIADMLVARRDMLNEYFSLNISEDGLVETLPLLLRDYTPNLDKLPLFLMRLGPQVEWTDEQACFDSFLRELALFYVPEPLISDHDPGDGKTGDKEDGDEAGEKQREKATLWQVQHVLFPAMARYLVPPKTLLDRDVVQVADLPDLYRVFERC